MSKIAKSSNWLNSDKQKIEDYITNADKDLRTLFDYLARFPKTYIQSAEPTIPSDEMAFWKDSDDNKFYLIKNIDGTQKKVELT